MQRRWLGLLSLVGMLACAGLEENDSAPRCSPSEPCPDSLTCYRNFCVEPLEGASSDGGSAASRSDASVTDAATAGADAAKSTTDAGASAAAPDASAPVASPAPTTPPPAATPPPNMPGKGNNGRWRYPWGLEQITNLPPYLIGCLGSCTIAGKKECESCVAEKERQQGSGSELFCHPSDDEDDDGCEARR